MLKISHKGEKTINIEKGAQIEIVELEHSEFIQAEKE